MVVVTATRKRRHSTGPVPSARCVGRAHAPPSWINERSRGREESATASENLGGTGFVVGVPMEGLDGVVYAYVIPTRHALGHSAFPAIRLNQLSGTWDVLETDRSTWLEHPSGDDVAACSVGIRTEHQVISVPVDFFVTEEMTEAGRFGLGDEVFMVSRHAALAIDESRESRNAPVLRFGNIASDPLGLEHRWFGINQESYLVEARSLSGHSGSPVFVWIDPYRVANRRGQTVIGDWHHNVGLLGVDWCHLQAREKLRSNDDENVESDEWHTRANSGMIGVIRAWRILEVLTTDEAKQQQRRERQEWVAEHGETTG